MDGGGAPLLSAPLLSALLLLVHAGTEAAVITVQSNSSTDFLLGNNISLVISYTTATNPTVSWLINGVNVVEWKNGIPDIMATYKGRLEIIGNGSLLITKSTKDDSGNYTVTVREVGQVPGTLILPVTIYDPVTNASVSQSPAAVDEKTPAVNLNCSTVTEGVTYTWTRDGQTLPSNSSYVTLDGGHILQIILPKRTHSGNYTCNASNPVDWKTATWTLSVSYTDSQTLSGGAIAGIVIGSIFGAILLILLIVTVIFCIRKRKKGQKEKKLAEPHKEAIRTVSGTTLSPDDPAYFTLNNIMYRNSSISMGSYIMNNGDNGSDYAQDPSPVPPPSQIKIKKATQV